MKKELNHKLLELINEGKSILIEIPTKKQLKAEIEYHKMAMQHTPGERVITDTSHEVLGDVFQNAAKEYLGIPKKYTKGLRSYTRRQQKYQIAGERERQKRWLDSEYQRRLSILNNNYLAWDKKVKDFLSKVSILDDGKIIANSKQLLRKIHRVGVYSKPETKIKHTLAFLEGYSVYTVVPTEAIKDYSIGRLTEKIRLLEESLRGFISTNLKDIHGDDWWVKAISPDVRKNAEERRKKAAKSNPEEGKNPFIHYIDFSDLSKILSRKDNKKIFHEKLRPIEAFIIKLKELEPIRNKLFHAREVKKNDVDKVNLYVKEFTDKIKKD